MSDQEARMVFRYLDNEGRGEIGFEEFKDIMYEERPPRERLFDMTYSAFGQ